MPSSRGASRDKPGRDNSKRKKSWNQLSFKNKRTRADLLAHDDAISHRIYRIAITICFAAGVTLLIGYDRQDEFGGGWVPLASMVALAHGVLFLLVRHYHREVLIGVRSFLQLFLLVGCFLLVSRALLLHAESPFWVPLPLLAMSLALIYSSMLAIHVSFGVACLVALMIEPPMATGTVPGSAEAAVLTEQIALVGALMVGSLVAIVGVHRIRNRKRLFIVGAASGIAQFVTIGVFSLWDRMPNLDNPRIEEIVQFLSDPSVGFANGVISGIVLTSALPFLEDAFEIVTDMKLIELSDQNKPLLHQMALLAPGTWQHSLMVGQLAEEAAQSIGANDLLARVGALYHDVGKMLKPNYFVENIAGGENPHDRLTPEMSRLVIISHVKDGMAILREERLPQPIVEMVPMHHGTTVVQYFFNKKRERDEVGHEKADQESFRYPGPRPTFPEAGILMLADTTEAIARTLKDPTPSRLRGVVRRVIHEKMADGQLDECDLTMRDLHKIEDAFVRVLASIHHQRIRYQRDVEEGEPSDPTPTESKGNGKGKASAVSESNGSLPVGNGSLAPSSKSQESKSQDSKPQDSKPQPRGVESAP